mgnify:CR=1 FL=1
MEVNKPDAAISLKRDGQKKPEFRHSDDDENQGEGYQDQQGENFERWAEDDAFQVDGGLSGPITPEVQGILDGLAAQIEPLRKDLERARARENQFHDKAQRHSYLPVFSRFGLDNEFVRVIGHLQSLGSVTFMCVSVLNIETIRREFGRSVYELGMVHVCKTLRLVLKENDSMGSLGGHDLGVLVLASSDDTVPQFIESIRQAFNENPFECNGTGVVFEVAVGGSRLGTNSTLSDVLALADKDQR